tara:strand:+ start:3760 stop:5139 length:1380 start_codon:yes stop_codon:yes gene_type:complete
MYAHLMSFFFSVNPLTLLREVTKLVRSTYKALSLYVFYSMNNKFIIYIFFGVLLSFTGNLFALNYVSSGNMTWAASGFPSPVVAGDSVYIQAGHTVTHNANLVINGKFHIALGATFTNTSKLTISNTPGYVYNDGTINLTGAGGGGAPKGELHVDGYLYNTGTANVLKMHNDGYICNSGLIALSPGEKFDFHGGEIECCGTILADIIKIHANAGVSFNGDPVATVSCQNFCGTDISTNPTFNGLTEAEFLGNLDPANSSVIQSSTVLCSPILPIELISFEANINDDRVDIKWVTASEINNDFFTVERSVDAKKWVEIIEVSGVGNSNSLLEYYETDFEPKEGISYYRLKQTDFDGNFEYFNIVPIRYKKNNTRDGAISLFPNPVNRGETVKLEFKNIYESELLVVLRDVSGREFYSKVIVNIEDGKLIGVPIQNSIPEGVYLVIASSENQMYSQKLVIK